MANDENIPIDIDTMSDEDFMKLDPSQMQEVSFVEEETPHEEDTTEVSNTPEVTPFEDDSESEFDPNESQVNDHGESGEDSEEGDSSSEVKLEDSSESSNEEDAALPKGDDEKPTKSDDDKKPEQKDKELNAGDVKTDPKDAVDFFDKVTAPFKADGRDMQIRSPEDAIRLMQMGVNYSRRMQEMKPLRAQEQMLKQNGLNDPEKMNFLIDLSKGNKDAIKKLLKDHKIDPIDIDTSSEDSPYNATNYQGDPKDLAFDDAIKETLSQNGGRALINDINTDWDTVSKEALRDQPSIFENILAQKESGVYAKINEELKYQRTMGFLTDVPFLQAYHKVGEAMQKAKVFDSDNEVQPQAKKPIGTGTRKAAPKPNTEQPTPNVSSATPPRSTPNNGVGKTETDYSLLSDEDFMKLSPPN
jgi:hypothetical protein